MKLLRTASFMLVVLVAVAAVITAGDTPIIGTVMSAPIVQASLIQPEGNMITDSQRKAFNHSYHAMEQRQGKPMEEPLCPACTPPCPPLCP